MLKKYDFGTLQLDDHIIIGEMAEGVDVDMDITLEILKVANETFAGEPWAYISLRTHSFSFNPANHEKVRKMQPNLVAFAVVITDIRQETFASMEKAAADAHYEFGIFFDLQTASRWVQSILANQ